jgi:hypothetical protein
MLPALVIPKPSNSPSSARSLAQQLACKSQRDQISASNIHEPENCCPVVTINRTQLPGKNEVKYLGLILDQKLTWRPHIIAKKTQINLKLRQMNWLIGRISKLTAENKLLLYKAIIKPVWSYGVQLWGCAKPSNTKIVQRVQSKILRMVFNAP